MLKTKLTARADLYSKIRQFFAERGVTEVETPLLCSHTVTDVHIDSISAENRFLQTSPEYCMKRLLCEGSGPIYQICKAFRRSESGSNHNPEFTMLEWYRPGFDHHQLMDELDELMQYILGSPPAIKQSYRLCFIDHVNIDPMNTNIRVLYNFLKKKEILHTLDHIDYDTALQVIMSEFIEPKIGQDQPIFIYDFPASQAALSKIREEKPPVAERFELYYKGLELANGFHELTDGDEQLRRFKEDQKRRHAMGLKVPEIDTHFIAVLQKADMPNSAGVAVGLDRLLMLKTKSNAITDVLNFAWDDC